MEKNKLFQKAIYPQTMTSDGLVISAVLPESKKYTYKKRNVGIFHFLEEKSPVTL